MLENFTICVYDFKFLILEMEDVIWVDKGTRECTDDECESECMIKLMDSESGRECNWMAVRESMWVRAREGQYTCEREWTCSQSCRTVAPVPLSDECAL